MTVTLTWLCDECQVATHTKRADDPAPLSTPNGWQAIRGGLYDERAGDYHHICPECLLKRVRREGAE